MVHKRSTTGTSGTNAPINALINAKKVEAGAPAEVEAEYKSEAESASVTTAELVEDSGEPYTDHTNFDKLFLDDC